MADPADKNDITMLRGDHTEIIKEGLKESYSNLNAIKDARFDINSRITENTNSLSQQIDAIDDTVTAQLITLARDTADLRAQVISAQQFNVQAFNQVAKDTEIATLKTQVALQQQSTYISDKIDADGEKTRGLINDLKTQDLNRMLIERNAEIVEERGERRHYKYAAEQGQWAALQSQIQAFGSQLSDARNSMVNFGTQLGVGQRATSNNVS
jgi:hypothetical protein